MVVQCFFTIEKKGRSIIGFLRIFPSSQLVFPLFANQEVTGHPLERSLRLELLESFSTTI